MTLNDTKASKDIVIIPACHNTPQLLKVLGDFKEKTVNEICVIIDCATKEDLELIENAANQSLIPIHVLSKSTKERGSELP